MQICRNTKATDLAFHPIEALWLCVSYCKQLKQEVVIKNSQSCVCVIHKSFLYFVLHLFPFTKVCTCPCFLFPVSFEYRNLAMRSKMPEVEAIYVCSFQLSSS